jgi:hypothetical protein
MRPSCINLCLGLLFVNLLTACFRQDIITVEISIPQMGSPECRQLVLQALGRLEQDAILEADLNTQSRVATIRYNSTRLALKNIEHAITAAGFDANEEKAPPEARAALPEECR